MDGWIKGKIGRKQNEVRGRTRGRKKRRKREREKHEREKRINTILSTPLSLSNLPNRPKLCLVYPSCQTDLPTNLFIFVYIAGLPLSIHPPIYPFYLSSFLSIFPSFPSSLCVCLSIYPSTYIHLSIYIYLQSCESAAPAAKHRRPPLPAPPPPAAAAAK